MAEDQRLGEMMLEIMQAGFADGDAWVAAGQPAEFPKPASIAVRDRLIAKDLETARRAYELLIDVMQKSLSMRLGEDAPPAA